METATVKEMFRALFRNGQAMTMVVAIVMINTALYIYIESGHLLFQI